MRRRLSALGFLALSAPGLALADATVAGKWQADLGSQMAITMDVSPDGHWSSQTLKSGKAVAQMSGVYKQRAKSPTQGGLLFTPTASKMTAQHGAPSVENDTYTVSENGKVLQLNSGGDIMLFHKQGQD